MQLSDSDDSLEHVRLFLRVWLMQHALVPVPGGPGFIGIDPGHDKDPVLHLLRQFPQPVHVVHHAVLVICGAGTDHQDKPVGPSLKDRLQFRDPLFNNLAHPACQRIHFLHFHGNRQFPFENHIHKYSVLPPNAMLRIKPI